MDRFKPPPASGRIRIVGQPMPHYRHQRSLDREYEGAWEDEQVHRKLDSLANGAGRYVLVRSRKNVGKPYAALFLHLNEDPDKVAEKLDAEILEIGDGLPGTAGRLEAERDRLNSVMEVMLS